MPQQSTIYAVARLRVLEKGLIGQDKITRLAEGTYQDAVRLLKEWGYGSTAEEDSSNPEALMAAQMAETKALIQEVTPDETLTNLFLMKHDVNNLKLLIKQAWLQDGEEPVLATGGVYDPAALQTMVKTQDFSALPKQIGEAIDVLNHTLETEGVDPQHISIALDRAYIEYAYTFRQTFIQEYFKTFADFQNVLTVLRLQAMGADEAALDRAVLPMGFLDESALHALFAVSADQMPALLPNVPIRESLKEGLVRVNNIGYISQMERQRDNTLMALVREGKNDIDTIRPVIGFLLAREQETRCIRLILTAKRNGLGEAMIVERLRDLYA